MISGVIIAILLYLPVYKFVINNPYVKSEGLFRFRTISEILPSTIWFFLAHRYVLIIYGLIGTILFFKSKFEYNHATLFCLVALLVPFMISFVRGDKPFYRVFIILLPFFAALLAFLCYGGIDVLQHYLLRAILAIKRYSPFNYPGLLEHTTRLIFTQKVGAGYIFIHRFLLEHFAATTSPKQDL